ncbi:MAG: hypothetical protein LKF49_05195 [Bifidobacterium tibiigranuli]|jgi:hypothetical protein|nr:hypothetical protein [Bifidobacterium tibiigranuli]MCH3974621.1 hypothetical protein [Bifidobacterium tibiigranuli]MCH4189654.1 hypothetical protein [Bifidobacterium tibiigranuli]MCH4203589.1 hypothetical protein [Bifidobacterium tibiigranuli]MCH4274204.1 hypothetical protein [Bifidobacterium tibiigranuli]MCI1792110.1 hypothetical protein [Bifidobacterium tibiigranuli]
MPAISDALPRVHSSRASSFGDIRSNVRVDWQIPDEPMRHRTENRMAFISQDYRQRLSPLGNRQLMEARRDIVAAPRELSEKPVVFANPAALYKKFLHDAQLSS